MAEDWESRFLLLKEASQKAFQEFKVLKQTHSDVLEELELTNLELQQSRDRGAQLKDHYARLSEVSKKAMFEFNELKVKYAEEMERRIAVEEEALAIQQQLQRERGKPNEEKAALMAEMKALQDRADTAERMLADQKKYSEQRDATYRNRIQLLETELQQEKEKNYRVQIEKDAEISKRHQVLSQALSGKSIDDLLKDLEEKVETKQGGSNRSRAESAHSDAPASPSTTSPTTLSPKLLLNVTMTGRLRAGSENPPSSPLPIPPTQLPPTTPTLKRPQTPPLAPRNPPLVPRDQRIAAIKEGAPPQPHHYSIAEEIKLGVKLKKTEPPPEKKNNRRPLSIYNNGSMGQLGSVLSQSSAMGSPSASASSSDLSGIGSAPADLNALFSQLEDVLNS